MDCFHCLHPLFLSLDLVSFIAGPDRKFKEALAWTSLWFAWRWRSRGTRRVARQRGRGAVFHRLPDRTFLSMDNVFVMALIFAYFKVPPTSASLLFWGILGALIMREE